MAISSWLGSTWYLLPLAGRETKKREIARGEKKRYIIQKVNEIPMSAQYSTQVSSCTKYMAYKTNLQYPFIHPLGPYSVQSVGAA